MSTDTDTADTPGQPDDINVADTHTITPAEQAALKAKTLGVSHLDYDWSLNDAGR